MTTASTAPPATARFRRAVAALAALGVVAFGLVPASAAYAAESVTFRVVDSANNPVSSQVIVRHADGITTQGVTLTNGSPTNPLLLAPGDYTLETWDFTRFLHNEMPFTVEAGIPRDLGDFVVDQFPAVTGTVPLDAAAAGVGVRAYRWDEDSSAWLQLNAWPYPVDPVDGSFTLWHYWDTDSTEFTLEFIADDGAPYFTTWLGGSTDRPWDQGDADTYALGAVNSVTDEGLTALVAAGIISGTVSDADSNPLEDASIWVHPDGDDSWGFSASTDSDGEYTVKVPLGDDYVAVAWASGFEDQYYDHVAELAGATPLSVTPITPRYSGIDFELNRVAELLVDVYADAGGVRQPLSVNGLLYREEGGSYSPIPFDWTYYEHSLDFDDLPQGTYRLGLQSVDETTWFPFSTIGLEPAGLGDTASACYLEFDVTGAEPLYHLEADADPSSTVCTTPPWWDAGGSYGTLSGTVLNIDDVTGAATASLYVYDGWGDPVRLLTAPVDPVSGAFVLPGVAADGEYVVGIETASTDPHLDWAVGDGDEGMLRDLYDGDVDGFDLDAGDDRPGVEVTLPDARVLSGVVRSAGVPQPGLCVLLIDENDEEFLCAFTDANGRYHVKAPVPADPADPLGYRIAAWADSGFPTFWGTDPLDGDLIDVAAPGVDPFSYDIALLMFPTLIVGEVAEWDADAGDSAPLDGGVAHLYRKSGTTWTEVETLALIDGGSSSAFVFPSEAATFLSAPLTDPLDLLTLPSLAPGDYRIWFSQDGQWLPITDYEWLRISGLFTAIDDGDFSGETCYLEASGMGSGTIMGFNAVLVDRSLTTNCAPPVPPTTPTNPPTNPPSTPGTSGSPSGAGESVEGDMGDEAEPDGAAEEPAGLTPTTPSPANPSPSPTPDPGADEPSDAGGLDLTWLWWTGGILLLIIVAGGVTLVVRRP